MKRLEFEEEIATRVPMLAQRDKDEWKKAEQVRATFVADYPLRRISSLTLDEFVIGKGADNRSFCYRLEREMDTLGKILGATAFKFGVYFGRTKSDPTNRYRFAHHWGRNPDEALAAVKLAIVDLIQSATKGDRAAIAANSLSPMFKGKILFVYNPDQFAPIYSEEHLEHFIAALDLPGSFECGADMQWALMEYRATWPQLLVQPAALYMRLLYDVFKYPSPNASTSTPLVKVPLLDEAIKGAQFITQMPVSSLEARRGREAPGKTDYEKQARQLKRVGDRGEALVVAMERKRLIKAGKPELAARVKRVSDEDDRAGYDVLSFDEEGTQRPIEVKATTSQNLDRGFYISSNEFEIAKKLPNFHIYLVFSTMTKQPRILPIKQPAFDGLDFLMQPVAYHVSLPQVAITS